MTTISYTDAPFPASEELSEAHRTAWRRLAESGTWWTGAERVAIADEVRRAWDCPLCLERKAAVSPYAVDGTHDSGGVLSEAAVDAVHRITTDPGRLTKGWFEKSLASGLRDGHYVEIVSVVTTVVSIDSFCQGIGIPLHALPEPIAGEPARERPENVGDRGAWVPMVGGSLPNVLRAMSLVPPAVVQLGELSKAHYLLPELVRDPRASREGTLDRPQTELIAARVSALRECFY